ncbi:glycyl-radical enzyme activating protein [Clostridium sp. YIM B02505]|uniref:Glycyl-radical enzyme activating protein n=1 Tax=Clostridium yunnanense TaxID=2800325 RepID=A0ABS1ERW6_9CLOT|nr:glycyl-radical enzyme activating protein [Clostridium yunnanense]MBK1812137.1 glycyl-radical enzyme activating protein [Clostridium yunnanense]
MIKTTVCEIEHYAVHDGPGIRTVVFLKGCPLKCLWCSNPETQKRENELYYNNSTCVLCKKCIHACDYEALSSDEKAIVIDRNRCIACGKCTDVCPTNSLRLVGKNMEVEEVFKEVLKDVLFYRQSGGGVTVSGGEVLMNADFAIELFKLCKDEFIHTAIETTGYGSFEKLKELSDYTDLILFDVKHSDDRVHKELTGVGNVLIQENLNKLSKLGKEIIIRIPLIPGLNDEEENIKNTVEIAKANGIREIHILPYHTLGLDKYRRLKKDYKLTDIKKHEPEYLESLRKLVENSSIKCIIGG